MLFNSYIFILLFLPFVVLGFYLLSHFHKTKLLLPWLLFNSLLFYGYQKPHDLLLIMASICFNYIFSKIISNSNSFNKYSKKNNPRKQLLLFGIFLNLLVLGYFKYIEFIFININSLLSLELPNYQQELPLGISFFTFLQIAYLVDVYKEGKEEENWINYSLFVTFFPHLIAGPIVHHKILLDQFKNKNLYNFKTENFAIGITIFILGLSKKVLIADNIAVFSSPVFNAVGKGLELDFLDAWGGTLAYTLQLYFDFSGYSDMAVGLSKLFNIYLPENFNSPYKSTSIIEFWRRWHITLSHFLRDYLYIPLGGSRRGQVRRYINLTTTMLLGGLWHGAGWTFVLWGGLHGLYLMVNHGWHTVCQWHSFIRNFAATPVWSLLSRIITFCAVVIGWVFFRAQNLNQAFSILQSMFNFRSLCWINAVPIDVLNKLSSPHSEKCIRYVPIEGWLLILCLLAVVWFAPNTQQLTAPFYTSQLDENLENQKRFSFSFTWALGISILMILCIINLSKASEFLYFSF